jgi:hypothetical protein
MNSAYPPLVLATAKQLSGEETSPMMLYCPTQASFGCLAVFVLPHIILLAPRLLKLC